MLLTISLLPNPIAFGQKGSESSDWRSCGLKLQALSGNNLLTPKFLASHSLSKDPEFLKSLMAVMYVESRFNPDAVSPKGAHGLLQMTPPAVLDAALECNLAPVPIESLLDPATNVRFGSCYLRQVLQEQKGNLDRALIVYNGGYRQLIRYDQGLPIANETAQYILQVRRALDVCGTK